MSLLETRVVEYGVLFETCRPVKFRHIHNTESSPYLGSRYQQDIEPAGFYELHANTPPSPPWVGGVSRFYCPLVIEFNPNPAESLYGPNSWKARLAAYYGATGEDLTRALLADGFDAIITVRGGGTSEIVALVDY